MIDPIWLGLQTAFDPYIAYERYIALDASIEGLWPVNGGWEEPDCVFLIHHAFILVEVHIRNVNSMDEGRSVLLDWMFNAEKTWKCSTITDVLDFTVKTPQNAIRDVNLQERLDKDKE